MYWLILSAIIASGPMEFKKKEQRPIVDLISETEEDELSGMVDEENGLVELDLDGEVAEDSQEFLFDED